MVRTISKKFKSLWRLTSHSIRKQLLISLMISIISVVVLLSLSLIYIEKESIIKAHYSECVALSENISRDLDYQLKNMDSAKRQLLYSADTMNSIYEYITSNEAGKKSAEFSELSHKLYSIISNGLPQMYMISLYGNDGSSITAQSSRNYSLLSDNELRRLGLYGGDFKTGTIILPPRATEGGTMISMLSLFSNTRDERIRSIIEIQQNYNDFRDIIQQDIGPTQRKVYVIDSDNEIIYPEGLNADSVKNLLKDDGDDKELLSSTTSGYSKWTVIVVEPKQVYISKVIQAISVIIAMGTVAILLCILLVYFTVGRVMKPMEQLTAEISNTVIDTLGDEISAKEGQTYNEYQQLRNSFNEMRYKLNESLQEYLASRREQAQTQLLALQSRMHPHFVNNVLASIIILLKHGEDEKAIIMCRDLSKMLTYSMRDFEELVTIADELEYTDHYVSLMKIRHGNRILYDVCADPAVYKIKVPKMIIQPLVENSIKHGMKNAVLSISVSVSENEGKFRISVEDNGRGFEKKKNDIHKNDDELAESGIGLENIGRRIELLYGADGNIIIESNAAVTRVTIAGLVMRETVQDYVQNSGD